MTKKQGLHCQLFYCCKSKVLPCNQAAQGSSASCIVTDCDTLLLQQVLCLQQCVIFSHADCQTIVMMQFMMPQGSRSRLRRDEMRTIVAHIYRLVATDLRPGALQEDATLRSKLTDWIVDTLKYLQSATAGVSATTGYMT